MDKGAIQEQGRQRTTRSRRALLAALALAWCGATWWLSGAYYDDRIAAAWREENAAAERLVANLVQGYDRIIAVRTGMPRVLARDPGLVKILSSRFPAAPEAALPFAERQARWRQDPELAAVSAQLGEDVRQLGLFAIGLIDSQGNCIAASNSDSEQTILGVNFADREYYGDIAAGRSGYQLTFGKLSGLAGIAFHAPIEAGGRVLGALVVRIELAPYANWLTEDAFLTDRHGVVVLAGDRRLEKRALQGAPVHGLSPLSRQASYGRELFDELALAPADEPGFTGLYRLPEREVPVIYKRGRLVSGAEPEVHVLRPFAQLQEYRQERLQAAVSSGLIGVLALLLASSLQLRGSRRRLKLARIAGREREFRTLAEHSPDGIVRFNAEGRITYANPRVERALGLPLGELQGKRPSEVPGAIDAGVFEAKVMEVLEGGSADEFEHAISMTDGRTLWLLAHVLPERDDEGKVRCVLMTVRNISRLKRVECALSDSQRRFAEAERIGHLGSWEFDHVNGEQYWSAELFNIYEIDPLTSGPSYADCLRVTHPDDRDAVDQEFSASLASGRPFRSEHRLMFADGRIKHVYELGETIYAADGRPLRTVGLVLDITERKRMEEALQRSEREFRSLAENVPDNIIRYDGEGRITYLNRTAASMLGVDAAVAIGQGPGLCNPTCLAAIRQVLDAGEPTTVELAPPDDASRLHEVRLFPEFDDARKVIGVLVIGRDVTELKRYEAELRAKNDLLARHREELERQVAERTAELAESERIFRSLAENAPENIARYDTECRTVYVNPRLASMLNAPLEKVIGRRPSDRAPGNERYLEYERHLRAAMQTGREMSMDMTVTDREGNPRYHHVRFVAEYDEAGKVTGVLALGLDLTEQRQAERQLRTLVENIPDYLCHYDGAGRIRYVNPIAVRDLGLDMERLIGRRLDEIRGPGPEYARAVQRVIDTGQGNTFEGSWSTARGERVFEIRNLPELDHEGKVVGVLGMARDITERKAAEEALIVREREFRTLAENLPDCVIRYDRQGRMTYVNTALRKTMGDIPVPLGSHPSELHAMLPAYAEKLDRLLADGRPRELEMHLHFGPREGATDNIIFVAERDDKGEIVGALAIGRDISELKEKERLLADSRDQIRQLASRQELAREEERRHIAREIHDELGQQLTALRLNVKVVDMRFGAGQPELHEAIVNLLGKVDRTIDVARNVATALRPATLDMGIVEALDWLVGEFRRNAEGIVCSYRHPDSVPALSEERAIVLFRIAQESLTNVARHSAAQSVVVALEKLRGSLVLEVIDDGIGFDPAGVNTRKFGLVGMRERVLAIGGNFMIDSRPGAGTRIKVGIPFGDIAE